MGWTTKFRESCNSAFTLELQNLLLDRVVWFLRTVDFSKGLAEVVTHYHDGIAALAAALDEVLTGDLSQDLGAARTARRQELVAANVPAELAGRIADLRALIAAPDIVLVADRTGYPVSRVAATYFAVAALFGVHRLTAAEIAAADYFDRLALDRARDAIGDAERKLTAAILAEGAWGSQAVAAWSAKRKAEVERVKLAIGEMVASGLTVSKLAVAASMLDDLARGRGVELVACISRQASLSGMAATRECEKRRQALKERPTKERPQANYALGVRKLLPQLRLI